MATRKASDWEDSRRGIRWLGRRWRREGTYEPQPQTVPRDSASCHGREARRLQHGAGTRSRAARAVLPAAPGQLPRVNEAREPCAQNEAAVHFSVAAACA
jgi:hypothetical protein